MDLVNEVEMAYANGDLPPWYYLTMALARVVRVRKTKALPVDGTAPPCRPIAVASIRGRATSSAVARMAKDEVAAYCSPHQVGVGVSGGSEQLVFGLRADMEEFPGKLFFKLDERNAYNEIERRVVCARCFAAGGTIASLGRMGQAEWSPISPLFMGHGIAPFTSANGGRQGMSIFPELYAAASLPEIRTLDASLGPGGFPRAFCDDTFCAADCTAESFDAVLAYGSNIARERNGSLVLEYLVGPSVVGGAGGHT